MNFRRQRVWLDLACRDPRLDPKHFRAAYVIWKMASPEGNVRLHTGRISTAAGISLADADSAIRRMAAVGYLHIEKKPPGGPHGAFLALPEILPARMRPPASSPSVTARSGVPSISEKCLPLLRVIADLAAEVEDGHFIPWRQIIRRMDKGCGPKDEDAAAYERRIDAARKRFLRTRAWCLDAGAIEIDKARAVRLTARGAAALAEP